MTDTPSGPALHPPAADQPLQFSRAEYAEDRLTTSACAICQTPIATEYYEVNGAVACATCRDAVTRFGSEGSSLSRFARALAAGAAAAAAGCLLYFLIGRLTGYEFGLIAALIGFAVGTAVRWGCYGRGGWRYQTLAVLLTYFAIAMTNVPAIVNAIMNRPPEVATTAPSPGAAPSTTLQPAAAPASASSNPVQEPPTFARFLVAVLLIVVLALVAPFLAGFQNLLGLAIIAFGLWEAWKINKRPVIAISGPHALSATPEVPPVPAV